MTTEFVVVLTTLPDVDEARHLVRTIVDRRLAACGSIVNSVQSIYRWEGEVKEASEVQVLFKTQNARVPALKSAICELHPYDIPEILALPIDSGLDRYLHWITAETVVEDAA